MKVKHRMECAHFEEDQTGGNPLVSLWILWSILQAIRKPKAGNSFLLLVYKVDKAGLKSMKSYSAMSVSIVDSSKDTV
jgi:hypothetical protein